MSKPAALHKSKATVAELELRQAFVIGSSCPAAVSVEQVHGRQFGSSRALIGKLQKGREDMQSLSGGIFVLPQAALPINVIIAAIAAIISIFMATIPILFMNLYPMAAILPENKISAMQQPAAEVRTKGELLYTEDDLYPHASKIKKLPKLAIGRISFLHR